MHCRSATVRRCGYGSSATSATSMPSTSPASRPSSGSTASVVARAVFGKTAATNGMAGCERRSAARRLDFPVLRIPVALEIGDERRTEIAIGLVARIGGAIAAEEIERLLGDAEGTAVGGRTHNAGAGQFIDDAREGGVHVAGRGDLVADEPALGTVAEQLALILNGLPCDAIAGEPRQ